MKMTVILEDDDKRVTFEVPNVTDFSLEHTFGDPQYQRNPFRVTGPPALDRLIFSVEPQKSEATREYYSFKDEVIKKDDTADRPGESDSSPDVGGES